MSSKHWSQVYDPLGNAAASTVVAALPIVVLLGCIALGRIKAHYAALIALATALLIALAVLRMRRSTSGVARAGPRRDDGSRPRTPAALRLNGCHDFVLSLLMAFRID